MLTSSEAVEVDEAPTIGPGTVLGGRHRLLHLLGEGGMGRVFLAHDEQEGGRVAVKVLADDRPIPKAAERFEREARSIARIDHDNVVKVSHVGQGPRGGLYYVMEHLQGEELATTLEREGPLPWWRVRHIGLQICGALQAAHEAGIVHRDLKLENCFRVTRGDDPDFIKILDFGVAKLLGPSMDRSGRLTNTGATLGTPVYMAPELCRGRDVDHRVDVYALGVMLYELLAGVPPFEGEGFLDVALQHMNEPPPPLSGHVLPEELPDGLEAVVMRALAKEREDRFPTMAAMGRALQRVGEDEPLDVPVSPDEPSLPITAAGGTAPVLPSAAYEGSGVRRTAIATVASVVAWSEPEPPSRASVGRVWMGAGLVLAAGLLAWFLVAAPDPPKVEPTAAPAVQVRVEPEPVVRVDLGTAVATTEPVEPVGEASSGGGEASGHASEARRRTSPRGLSRAQIDAALRRIQPRISACAGGLTGAQKGDRVRVTFELDRATGRVESASASAKRGGTVVESCVTQVLRSAKFPREGRGLQQVERTLAL